MSDYLKQEFPKRREPSEEEIALDKLVKDASPWLFENPALERIEDGQLTPEQWRQFSVERYTAASDFVELLKTGIETAEKLEDTELAKTLQANLNDELGIDAKGIQHEKANHETWRKNFYRAIGVLDAVLNDHKMHPKKWLEGTSRYHETVKELIAEGNAFAIAGALFALEATIPTEFQRISAGRDRQFPDLTDDERLYIDSHIEHDKSSHYPDLQRALAKYVHDADAIHEIQRGVKIIMGAKGEFYKSIEKAMRV